MATSDYIGKITQGDAIETMRRLDDKSIDMILCDLPYGTTECKWDTVIPFQPLWEQYKRIIKDNGAIVLTSSQPFTSALLMSNPKMFKHAWVWNKKQSGSFANAKYRPLQITEDVLVFATKGKIKYFPLMRTGKLRKKGGNKNTNAIQCRLKPNHSTYNDQYYPTNLIEISNANKQNRLHPTQKPVELFDYLIRTYTNAGDIVLDNCIGSGTTAVAAMITDRRFIGIEREPEYCEIARKRIESVTEGERIIDEVI